MSFDHVAEQALEIIVGFDRIVRVNVDGICALRVRLKPGADYVVTNLNTLVLEEELEQVLAQLDDYKDRS